MRITSRHLIPPALLALTIPLLTNGAAPFDKKLSRDDQAFQALNRLTFGARPGDVEAIRKMGVDKWIDLQLHPDRIPENPILETKLAPLETLRLSSREIVDQYPRPQPNQQNRRNQTAQPAKPQANQPPPGQRPLEALANLLTPDQLQALRDGTPQERQQLLQSLDPAKRRQIRSLLPARGPAGGMANATTEARREAVKQRQPLAVVASDLMEGKIYRALYSNRQLEEVLVDFWFNHFNVYIQKGAVRELITSYERDAIRPHVLGKFGDLVLATARHPAMLFYLDNWQSVDPEAAQNRARPRARRPLGRRLFPGMQPPQPPPQRQARGLNENYGRELMELHTLGVDGGYNQDDVINVARAFTGWTIRQPRQGGDFQFVPQLHDNREKIVLGHTIPAGGGESDGRKVIDILVHQPATARFISTELAQRFVADHPPESLIRKMADTFTKTDGDIRAVLHTMFISREFFSEGAYRSKIKSPFEMVISAVRALDANVDAAFLLSQRIDQLGEPIYRKEEPTGYPNTSDEWINTAGLLGRMNFASELTRGRMRPVTFDIARFQGMDAPTLAQALLGIPASPQTLQAIQQGLEGKQPTPELIAGLVLGSPDFQRR